MCWWKGQNFHVGYHHVHTKFTEQSPQGGRGVTWRLLKILPGLLNNEQPSTPYHPIFKIGWNRNLNQKKQHRPRIFFRGGPVWSLDSCDKKTSMFSRTKKPVQPPGCVVLIHLEKDNLLDLRSKTEYFGSYGYHTKYGHSIMVNPEKIYQIH